MTVSSRIFASQSSTSLLGKFAHIFLDELLQSSEQIVVGVGFRSILVALWCGTVCLISANGLVLCCRCYLNVTDSRIYDVRHRGLRQTASPVAARSVQLPLIHTSEETLRSFVCVWAARAMSSAIEAPRLRHFPSDSQPGQLSWRLGEECALCD